MPPKRPLLITKHERCTCGHCRCQHDGGYADCNVKRCTCIRYTWPGGNANLPDGHIKQKEKA